MYVCVCGGGEGGMTQDLPGVVAGEGEKEGAKVRLTCTLWLFFL